MQLVAKENALQHTKKKNQTNKQNKTKNKYGGVRTDLQISKQSLSSYIDNNLYWVKMTQSSQSTW